jgi:hypothetical protein
MKPEEKYRKKIDLHFQKFFEIEREVKSFCGNGIIDYILKDKHSDALFGVEVKKESIKRGTNFGNYAKQASRYTTYEWNHKFDGSKKLLIFITPAISSKFIELVYDDYGILDVKKINNSNYYRPRHDIDFKHHNLNGFLSETLNIGEIKTINKGQKSEFFAFIYKSKIIWRSFHYFSKPGVHEVNYNFYMDKLLKGKL